MNVNVRSIQYNLAVYSNTSTGISQNVRMLLLLDRQPNGVGITSFADFLTPNSVYGLRSLAVRKRFKILQNKLVHINANNEPFDTHIFQGYLKLKRPISTEYNQSASATIVAISTNALYLCIMGSAPPGASAATMYSVSRIRYTDM